MASSTCVALLALTSSFASAEDKAEAPEDATVYSAPRLPGSENKDDPNTPRIAGIFIPPPSYRSDVLQGNFVGKPMFVLIDRKKLEFWGARAVGLDPESPLRKFGFEVGDVLTRLDGITVDTEKFEERGVWQIPELERHYGPTEVKWIKQGTHAVNVDQLDLGDVSPGETVTLRDHFSIGLQPGFKHEQLQGIDSLPGRLFHRDGREIHYDIGRYYPPGQPRTGGAYENQAQKAAAKANVVVKQQTIAGQAFDVTQTDEGLTISTVSVPHSRGINFFSAAKTPADVADVLLMVLSLQAPPVEPPAP